jgi:hypothetical protein
MEASCAVGKLGSSSTVGGIGSADVLADGDGPLDEGLAVEPADVAAWFPEGVPAVAAQPVRRIARQAARAYRTNPYNVFRLSRVMVETEMKKAPGARGPFGWEGGPPQTEA